MAFLHVMKIESQLKQDYQALYSALKERFPKQDESAILSKVLAGHALVIEGGIDQEQLLGHITDGPNDRGLDAAFYNPNLHRLTFVQSKWKKDGTGSVISEKEAGEFVNGIKEVLNRDLPKAANECLQALDPEFQAARDDFGVEVRVVVIATAESQIADLPKKRFDDLSYYLGEDQVSIKVLNQAEVYRSFNHSQYGPGVTCELKLHQIQSFGEPFRAWYGFVTGLDIAELFNEHGEQVMARNLRGRLGDTEINQEIFQTALKTPENFWYFNNGLTIIADKIERKMSDRRLSVAGDFKLTNGSIVNGAQTTSTLYELLDTDGGPEALADVKCLVRLIELPEENKAISRQVTQYNNSQNGVGAKDFVALEPFQKELQRQIDQRFARTYYVRSGERERDIDPRDFDLQEATVALVCAGQELRNVVKAKSGISALWRDVNKEPYTAVFDPDRVTADSIVKAVDFLRDINKFLKEKESSDEVIENLEGGRSLKIEQVAKHGNRLFAHFIMREFDVFDSSQDVKAFLTRTSKVDLQKHFEDFCYAVHRQFPDSYVARLFKNQEKCFRLSEMFQIESGLSTAEPRD